MKKRLFSLLLSVLLVLALIPGAAFAADTGLYFTVTDGEAALTETSWKLSGDVTIPAAYQGAPVTSIADDAFEARREVTSVTVPEGVKTIGSRAFGNCSALESVSLPSSLVSLGAEAFSGCDRLAAITLPEGVTSVEAKTFYGCTALSSAALPSTVTVIGSEAFHDCTALGSIALPEGLGEIGSMAFLNCRALKDVSFPASLKTIGARAFSGCGFERLELPESVTALADRVFFDCQSLVELTVPASVTSIGAAALGANSQSTLQVHFLGAAPELSDTAFANRVMVVDYPASEASWAAATAKDYGAYDIHWTAIGGSEPGEDPGRDDSAALKPLISDNHADQNYLYAWAQPVNSYLFDNGDGTRTRVEYSEADKAPVVEIYNAADKLIWKQVLPMELDTWGGFFAGSEYNFLVFGQDNLEDDDSAESIRVVRYSKNWHRIDAAALRGSNVRQPFVAGSLRMAQAGDILYIHTTRNMYKTADGKVHQSNFSFNVHIPTMSAIRETRGYASHSFNQFVFVDGANVVRLDHGDAYPRALVITRFVGEAGSLGKGELGTLEVLPILGKIGANATGVQAGGFAASSTHYLTVGKSIEQVEDGSSKQNIFVIATDKVKFDAESNTMRWLTSLRPADAKEVSNPQLVPVGNDRFLLLWCETGADDHAVESTLRYVFLSASGETASQIYSAEHVWLSDCQPILAEGKVQWYATGDNELNFYRIDPLAPETVAKTTIAGDFVDVPEGAYYADPVAWAVEKGVTNGTSKTTFSPNKTCTRAEMVTFLWRAAGSPKPESAENPFDDVPAGRFYTDAVLWAVEQGITQGTSETTFSPNETVTRAQTVTFLWRMAKRPAPTSETNPFKDVPAGKYYTNAVLWAVEKGITNGTEPDAFEPSSGCTRGQIVTFLYRYLVPQA